ncbi:MAG: DNA-3-methyladenine glycosylase I [Geminicoccaceae bacterium]
MSRFSEIHEAALVRHGRDGVEARLPKIRSADELRAFPPDRYLSAMSLRIFRAGLKHSVVDAKWPAFEEAFAGFDVQRVAAMFDEEIEALLGDKRLIRHLGKLRAVRHNAAAMLDIGDFAGWIAGWPGEDIIGLWAELEKRMSQLGGRSGPYFLRMVGKDGFILTPSVASALAHWQLVGERLSGKAGNRAAQAVFNELARESGLPLAHISMILAPVCRLILEAIWGGVCTGA